MRATITVESAIAETPRVAQLRGLFDLPAQKTSRLTWEVDLPIEEKPWSIGLITGPSGCGKSTVARRVFPPASGQLSAVSSQRSAVWLEDLPPWPTQQAVVDGFPPTMPVKEVAALLSSVGFSSPPAWLRPYPVLSTGQKFRCDMARLLSVGTGAGGADGPASGIVLVCDEFTSVVDRTVAQVGSAAVGKAIRARKGLRFVAVTCHDDVIDWLQPDWLYRPAESSFEWRCLRRRPPVRLAVARCGPGWWRLFSHHHYLSHSLAAGAACFLATLAPAPAGEGGRPVAFSAWLPFVGRGRPARREHRTVTLPDFQGVGIGHALSGLIASLWRGLGYRALSTTTHPALIAARLHSPFWQLRRAPSLAGGGPERLRGLRHATTRLTAGFEYTGPALPRRLARLLLGG